jgi:hypothetical protein
VARDVLRHRLMLSYEALAKSLDADDVLNRLLSVIPAAAVSPRDVSSGSFSPTSPNSASAYPGPSAPIPTAPMPVAYPNPSHPGSNIPAPPPAPSRGSLPPPAATSVMPLPPPTAALTAPDPSLGLPPVPRPVQPGLAKSAPPAPHDSPVVSPGSDRLSGAIDSDEAD